MAEEFQVGGGNWWESSRLNQRFESSGGSSSSSSSSTIASIHHNDVSMADWSTHLVLDTKPPKSSLDSVSIPDDGALLSDHAFHMMGLGLSPQPIPWNNNPSLFGSNANFQQDSSYDYDKQMNRLSLDHAPPRSVGGAAASSTTSSDMDRSASTTVQLQADELSSPPMNFSYDISPNYIMKPGGDVTTSPTWSKFPQFLRPKQPPPPQLQFSNNTTFWNAMNDAQFSLFPIHEKPKNISGARYSGTVVKKKAGSTETSSKRPRDQNDTPTSMPAFKVRKEKMGDRITALQQLISPFGKTDTASVLSETIEYIKFLHDQVNILCTPYIKSGASMRHQQNMDKSKNLERASWQDLKSRGLCLVPISSATFPASPTFGGCFR